MREVGFVPFVVLLFDGAVSPVADVRAQVALRLSVMLARFSWEAAWSPHGVESDFVEAGRVGVEFEVVPVDLVVVHVPDADDPVHCECANPGEDFTHGARRRGFQHPWWL